MKMRLSVVRVCLLLALVAAAACAPAAPTVATRQPVRLCYAAISGANIVAWYAFEKGLFQKYGLEPELSFISGAAPVATALVSHQVDFCTSAGSNIVNSVAAGQDMVMIEGFYDRMLFNLVVGPSVQKPEDLIGKAIAIGAAQSVKETAARVALKHLGLDADTQITFTPFRANDEPAMAAAVESGSAAGAILAPPLLGAYRAAGLRVLLDISTVDSFYLRLGLGTTRSFIKDHRDIALAMVKVTLDSIASMKQDPAGTQAVLAKYLKLDPTADKEALAEAYDIFVVRYLASEPKISEAGLQAVMDEATLTNPAAASVKIEQLMDPSLLQEVEDSGFNPAPTP